ncbi:DUF6517 family protein [Halobacteria archaeon AArc-dxtr1]|nr:DUF6517 family protein [Halobacteria archaeon AArc-dxtr1]
MNRRSLLAGCGAAGLAGLAGCLGLVGMDEHEASPAGVDVQARDETGYRQTGIDDVVVDRDVGAGPLSSEVSATNYVTEHEKTIDMGILGEARGAMFMVLTTPQIGLLGRNFNPVEDMSAAELIELVEDNYDEIGNVEEDTSDTVEILDQSTTQTRFTADAVFEGQSLQVYLHVSEAVQTDDDLLVTIGVYPRQLRSQEEPLILELMAGVDEDAHEDATTDEEHNSSADDGETDGVLGIVG